MKWFRSNIRMGSRLALLALALQLGLSFGHFHADIAQAAPETQSVVPSANDAATLAAPDSVRPSAALPAPHDDPDQHRSEGCALCAILSLVGTAILATPSALPLPQAQAFRYLVAGVEFTDLDTIGLAFQPRAPPRLLKSMT